jgi:ABC-type glycerol-3-phosphate transport system substrate-binding protein
VRPSPRSAARPPSRRQAHALLLAAAPAGAAATACGDSGGSGDAITLEFWAWADIQPAIDLWNETHPRIRVEMSAPAGGESIFQRLSAAIAAGSGAPDLVQVDHNNLHGHARADGPGHLRLAGLHAAAAGGLLRDAALQAGRTDRRRAQVTRAAGG